VPPHWLCPPGPLPSTKVLPEPLASLSVPWTVWPARKFCRQTTLQVLQQYTQVGTGGKWNLVLPLHRSVYCWSLQPSWPAAHTSLSGRGTLWHAYHTVCLLHGHDIMSGSVAVEVR